MSSSEKLGGSEEFEELKNEILDEDPIVRGMAAVDLGPFASEHPEYQEEIISILEKALNDPDADVQNSAKTSLAMIEGKPIIEQSDKQIISFGYVPQEYRQPEVNQKQMAISCICCIVLIVVISLIFIL